MNKEFPYYARFDSVVKASVNKEVDKYLSKASLEDLKRLDLGDAVDLENNIDLIGTIFNAAVINRLNKNDDGMSTKTALAIKKLFIHKPHNLEHKSNRIVGHIVKAGWSTFPGNKMLSDDEVASMTEPFNLVLGGVVYRLIDEKFADMLIESSDETSGKYMQISTSWEVGFTDYHIVLGSKNVNEAEIVSDPERIKELKKHLKAFGGTGSLPDGTYIGRLIVGEIGEVLPVGMAFTSRPAAEVEGVITSDWTDLVSESEIEGDDDKDDDKDEEDEEDEDIEEIQASTQNNEQNNSQTSKIDVKENNQAVIHMAKITDIKQLIAASTSKEGLSEASASEFIQSQIEQKSAEWEAKITAKETALTAASAKAAELETQLASANTKLNQLEVTVTQLKTETEAKSREEAFQGRMTALANEFELSDKENQVIAKEIRVLDEVAYASWYEKFSIFADSKKKVSIAAAKDALEAKIQEAVSAASKKSPVTISTASATPEPSAQGDISKAALDNTSEVTASIPNAAPSTPVVDAKKEWSEAFGGTNIKITT